MNVDIVRIRGYQKVACYRMNSESKEAVDVLTWPLPPISTIKGWFHSVLNAKEYIPLAVSVSGDYNSKFRDVETILKLDKHLDVAIKNSLSNEERVLIYDLIKRIERYLEEEAELTKDNKELTEFIDYFRRADSIFIKKSTNNAVKFIKDWFFKIKYSDVVGCKEAGRLLSKLKKIEILVQKEGSCSLDIKKDWIEKTENSKKNEKKIYSLKESKEIFNEIIYNFKKYSRGFSFGKDVYLNYDLFSFVDRIFDKIIKRFENPEEYIDDFEVEMLCVLFSLVPSSVFSSRERQFYIDLKKHFKENFIAVESDSKILKVISLIEKLRFSSLDRNILKNIEEIYKILKVMNSRLKNDHSLRGLVFRNSRLERFILSVRRIETLNGLKFDIYIAAEKEYIEKFVNNVYRGVWSLGRSEDLIRIDSIEKEGVDFDILLEDVEGLRLKSSCYVNISDLENLVSRLPYNVYNMPFYYDRGSVFRIFKDLKKVVYLVKDIPLEGRFLVSSDELSDSSEYIDIISFIGDESILKFIRNRYLQ